MPDDARSSAQNTPGPNEARPPVTIRVVVELALDDFERTTFEHGGKRRTVFRRGEGPAVIIMAELPGITPKVLRFAGWVADIGCTAVVPHLFGVPGRHPGHNTLSAGAYVNYSFLPACVSRPVGGAVHADHLGEHRHASPFGGVVERVAPSMGGLGRHTMRKLPVWLACLTGRSLRRPLVPRLSTAPWARVSAATSAGR